MVRDIKLKYVDFKNWPAEDFVDGTNSGFAINSLKTGKPLIFKHGAGSKLYDFEKQSYLDLFLSDGALILGHGHRNLETATKVAVERGLNFGGISRDEAGLARFIKEKIPSVEKVGLFGSEFEAIHQAANLAKLSTGRKKIITFVGCYSSQFLSDQDVIYVPYGDSRAFLRILSENKKDIAGIIIEPIPTYRVDIRIDEEFLNIVCLTSKDIGACFIADEITCGWRVLEGSVCQAKNIDFDLICLGRVIGGGFSFGAVAGKKEVMNGLINSRLKVLPFSPVVARTALATLRLLDKRFYQTLNEKVMYLKTELEKNQSDFRAYCQGSMLGFILNNSLYDKDSYYNLWQKLLKAGILFQPDFRRPFYISSLHTKNDLKRIVEMFKK
ncbi:MAG: aminotransferase class III-fold pyridoxal phosphate-dependent enzyme [Candidatus Omnitrophica bacterium]|nr:aminotransferase class III-fold pyridoxal phosphate-dependent enzyme [Candidatus Omnitrophota bacterium]